MKVKKRTVTGPEGKSVEVSSRRLNAKDELMRVRAFYLDIAQWAAEEPTRWGPWAVPCPIRDDEIHMAKERKRRKARMDQRTRERLPILPILVSTTDFGGVRPPSCSRRRRRRRGSIRQRLAVSPSSALDHAERAGRRCVGSVGVEAVDQAVEEPGESGFGGEGASGGGKGFGEFRVAAVGSDSGEVAGLGCGPVRGL